MAKETLTSLLVEVRACQHCIKSLPLGPRPVLAAGKLAKILIIGHAQAFAFMNPESLGTTPAENGCGNGWRSAKKTSTTKTKSRLFPWDSVTPEQERQVTFRLVQSVPSYGTSGFSSI